MSFHKKKSPEVANPSFVFLLLCEKVPFFPYDIFILTPKSFKNTMESVVQKIYNFSLNKTG